jgi:hypothetical protein
MAQSLFLLLGNSATGALRLNHKRANAAWFRALNKKPRPKAGADVVAVVSAPDGSVLPVQADQFALNPDPVRRQDADFVGGVGGLQRD